MDQIKACPFCGNEAYPWYKETRYGRICYVECDVCGAKTRAFAYYDTGKEFADNDAGALRAVEAWNRREGTE